MLFRVAEQYLNLCLNINQREWYPTICCTISPQGTPPPSYDSYFSPGFYLDAIWSIGPHRQYAEALERIWNYFDEEDPELIAFLRQQHHPGIRTMEDVRGFIQKPATSCTAAQKASSITAWRATARPCTPWLWTWRDAEHSTLH